MKQLKAISIRQPWASLIIQGFKDIENRINKNPFLNYRGTLYIHAPKTVDHDNDTLNFIFDRIGFDAFEKFFDGRMPCGGIIGRVNFVDLVEYSDSPWFCGPYGLVLKDPEPLSFLPCKGQLGLWNFSHRSYES